MAGDKENFIEPAKHMRKEGMGVHLKSEKKAWEKYVVSKQEQGLLQGAVAAAQACKSTPGDIGESEFKQLILSRCEVESGHEFEDDFFKTDFEESDVQSLPAEWQQVLTDFQNLRPGCTLRKQAAGVFMTGASSLHKALHKNKSCAAFLARVFQEEEAAEKGHNILPTEE